MPSHQPMQQEVVPGAPYNPQAYMQYPVYPQQQGYGGHAGFPQYQQQQGYPPYQQMHEQPPQAYGQPTHQAFPEHTTVDVQPGIEKDQSDWGIPDEKRLTGDIDIKIRHGFIQKVYGILFCQLAVTFGLCTWFNQHRAAALWLYRNPWVMIVAAVLMCASVCTLACVPKAARKSPTNYILLALLSVSMGAVLGYSTGAVDTIAFVIAVGSTAAVTIGVSLFACQTKWDFTGMGPYLLVGLLIMIVFGLVAGFVRNKITHIVYGALGALLFSVYLIVDTQKIVGGKHRKYEFSIDDYAFAALALYMDIINIFMYILTIVSATQN